MRTMRSPGRCPDDAPMSEVRVVANGARRQPRLVGIRIQRLERCGECGNFKGFDAGFTRRVDELYVVPSKSRDYSVDRRTLKAYCIQDRERKEHGKVVFEDHSPEGLYAGIIVPKGYVGRLLRLVPLSEEQAAEDDERRRKEHDQQDRQRGEETPLHRRRSRA